MIRTIVKPDKQNYNLTLMIPENYIGKNIEIIAFSTEEATPAKKNKKKNSNNNKDKASILKSISKGVEEVKKHKQGKSRLLTVDEFFKSMKK